LKPDRWERVKELFEAALEQPSDRRARFLIKECRGDEALRSEVESLLAEYDSAGSFMDQPPAYSAPETARLIDSSARRAKAAEEERDAALCGQVLSHYRIHEQIGSGGMGSVYRAEDLTDGREVALKFLRSHGEAEQNAMARFQREAVIASSLNHPNICRFYSLDEAADTAFISMELLRGQTLHHSIFRQPSEGTVILDNTPFVAKKTEDGRAFDAAALLEISLRVLDGLEAAHSKNIVHRDIKPANIYLTRDGQVKILDFGLAKFVRPARSATPWRTAGITKAGIKLGTLTYMSPEQIRGEPVDARTDLFSFGLVMFEMATGRRAFPSPFMVQVWDAIMSRSVPAVHEIRPELPPRLSAIVSKAAAQDRKQRYRSAREMRHAVELLARSC
jgi:serine/threonine protein kinase